MYAAPRDITVPTPSLPPLRSSDLTAHAHGFQSTVANRAAGMVGAASILLPWATYRAFHLEHHIHTADADDPEGVPIVFRSRLQYALLIPIAGTVFAAQLDRKSTRLNSIH